MKKYLKLALVALLAVAPSVAFGAMADVLAAYQAYANASAEEKADALAALEQAMTEEVAGADDVVSAMADLTEAVMGAVSTADATAVAEAIAHVGVAVSTPETYEAIRSAVVTGVSNSGKGGTVPADLVFQRDLPPPPPPPPTPPP